MRRFTHKLLSGQPISLSAVGGSITAGQGARYGMPYMKRIWDWIEDVSPNANHYLKHAAFGGSTSGPHGVLALAILNLAVGDTL